MLDRITGIIADHGEDRHLKDEALKYACDVSDSLSWALGDIDTESFTGPDYFNLDRLVAIVMEIERKRGRQARLLLMRLVAYAGSPGGVKPENQEHTIFMHVAYTCGKQRVWASHRRALRG